MRDLPDDTGADNDDDDGGGDDEEEGEDDANDLTSRNLMAADFEDPEPIVAPEREAGEHVSDRESRVTDSAKPSSTGWELFFAWTTRSSRSSRTP